MFDEIIDKYREAIIRDTQKLIKVKSYRTEPRSGMPFGEGCNEALELMLDMAREEGFCTGNADGYAGYAEYGQGKKMIGALTHLDVVPEGNGWNYPPYEGIVKNDRVYGRGAIDNKGPVIATFYALKAIKESGLDLKSRIRLIWGLDEETNWECLTYYLKTQEVPDYSLVPDAYYPVCNCEKGLMDIKLTKKVHTQGKTKLKLQKLKGGQCSNIVPDYCEAEICGNKPVINSVGDMIFNVIQRNSLNVEYSKENSVIKLKSYGKLAHASMPEQGFNAISQMMIVLSLVAFTDKTKEFIDFYKTHIGMDYNGILAGCGFKDDISGRLTLNIGTIELNNGAISFSMDIRYPVSTEHDTIINKLKNVAERYNIEVTGIKYIKPHYVEEKNLVVKTIMEEYQDFYDKKVRPVSIGFRTYAYMVPNGVAFGPSMPETEGLAHKKDEYISIENLINTTKIYARVLYKLANKIG